jgi:hypothetical protein
MNYTRKTFLGAGATMYLGLGVVPQRVRIYNALTGLSVFDWNVGMLANAATAGGIYTQFATGTQTTVAQTQAQGLVPYLGGDIVTSKTAAQVVDPGARADINFASNLKGNATKFVMDTAANGTGHFNVATGTTGYGVGSPITMSWRDDAGMSRTKNGRINALTSTGLTADYVGIDLPFDGTLPASGADIVYIGPQYDLVQAPVGVVMPAGVKLLNTTYLTSAVMYQIEFA